jgi:hypothetical protein
MRSGGGGSKRVPRVVREPFKSRILDLARAAEYVGLSPSSLAGMVSRGALPVIRYPGFQPWMGISKRMFFDVRDLDQFIEINKEFGHEESDGKRRLDVRNSDEVNERLRRNYLWRRGSAKHELIPDLPPTMEDVLMLVLRSKSMQGFSDAIGNPEYPHLRGLSSNTCLQIFLIGWYARNSVTPELLSELDALIRELRPPAPESFESPAGATTTAGATRAAKA